MNIANTAVASSSKENTQSHWRYSKAENPDESIYCKVNDQ
ncbi:hypothetical protein YPPY64_3777 [Yersinia pestis PY-64]|nr:hypothetical protein YPPY32_3944 [Yersinia pestis PY-32]EIS56556.1 hypothetical protein YPPY64_3777 [Yersinia pestis PY-64]